MKIKRSNLQDSETVTRRGFVGGIASIGIGAGLTGLSALASGSPKPNQPEADSGHDYPMPKPHAKTEAEFRKGVIGPATLSRMVSEMAVDRASNAHAKEFANFELREAIAVTTVLHNLNTPPPPMTAQGKATLSKIKNAETGIAFDKAYIAAQLANHEFLRDLAEVYLENSKNHTSMAEMHGRHLATLALATFKEHVVHTKNILAELNS